VDYVPSLSANVSAILHPTGIVNPAAAAPLLPLLAATRPLLGLSILTAPAADLMAMSAILLHVAPSTVGAGQQATTATPAARAHSALVPAEDQAVPLHHRRVEAEVRAQMALVEVGMDMSAPMESVVRNGDGVEAMASTVERVVRLALVVALR